jgi:hypothetical protein
MHILHYQTINNWQGFFLWAFQVFVVYILLGLFAFDYVSVRSAGKNWETLLEIHGLFPLGVWTSGITVGLATAVSSWITNPTQVGAWLNSALQIILPVISQTDKLVIIGQVLSSLTLRENCEKTQHIFATPFSTRATLRDYHW